MIKQDHNGWLYREFKNPQGSEWREYQLDPVIARRVMELKLGLVGCRQYSWRALAIKVTGHEDQMTGSDIERLACWTLRTEEGCWCERCEDE